MEKELTIKQVSQITGLSEHTLRYYEKINLLDPVGRSLSGARVYTETDVTWIHFLNRLRATGMSIRKMQEYADLRRQGEHTLMKRNAMLKSHYKEVLKRISELQGNLAEIEKKMKYIEELMEQKKLQGEDHND